MPGTVLNQRIHFAVLMLKPSFNFLEATTESQKCSKNGTLLETDEVRFHAKDPTACSKTDWQVRPNKCILKSFKYLVNNLEIYFTCTQCISMVTF